MSISNAIKIVRFDKRNRGIKCGKIDDDSTTLHQCFLTCNDQVLKAALDDRKAGDGGDSAVEGTVQSTATSSSETESTSIQSNLTPPFISSNNNDLSLPSTAGS